MELKKNPEANLEKSKVSVFFTGLLFALALTLIAWEWSQFEKVDTGNLAYSADNLEDEMVPVSIQKPPPPPPPPQQTTVLEIVEDEEDIEEELEMEDMEIDEDTEVEIIEEEEEEVVEDKIFTIVEQNPEFPGGYGELQKYLAKNIKYPSLARDAGIQGTVYVTFEVAKDGTVKSAKVLRGIGGGCDKEALRVVSRMPKWKPGKQRGKPVRVQFNLPVKFTLQ